MTTGSPDPLNSQTPTKPLQIVEMPTGPRTEAPVVLLKTWKPSLTIWTYCVAPTSPVVSGGAQSHPTPGNGIPSKLRVGDGMRFANWAFWRTRSNPFWWIETGRGLVAASRSAPEKSGPAGIARTGGETSFLYERRTVICGVAGTEPVALGTGQGEGLVERLDPPPPRTTLA